MFLLKSVFFFFFCIGVKLSLFWHPSFNISVKAKRCFLEAAEVMRSQSFLDNCFSKKHCHPFCCFTHSALTHWLRTPFIFNIKLLAGRPSSGSGTKTGQILQSVKIWVKNCSLPLTPKYFFFASLKKMFTIICHYLVFIGFTETAAIKEKFL